MQIDIVDKNVTEQSNGWNFILKRKARYNNAFQTGCPLAEDNFATGKAQI